MARSMLRLMLLVGAVAGVAAGWGQQAASLPAARGNTAPKVTAVIIAPASPTVRTGLAAGATASDPDGDTLTYQYQWCTPIGLIWSKWGYTSSTGALKGATLAKGQRWRARCRVFDGIAYSDYCYSATITIGNAVPQVTSVWTIPASPDATSSLDANANASDADGDPLTWEFTWSQYSGNAWGEWGHSSAGGNLGEVALAKGQVWRARCRVSDGTAWSSYRYSSSVTIGNARPQMTTVSITPEQPVATTILRGNGSGRDIDAGDVLLYEYQWSLYGDGAWGEWGYTGMDGRLLGPDLVKGQQWKCRCRAWDGSAWSGYLEAAPVTVRNSVPAISSVALSPATATAASTLSATAYASDADAEALTYQYQWSLYSGASWGAFGRESSDGVLRDVVLAKGQRWKARCRVSDGTAWSAWVQSPEKTVANSRPVIATVPVRPVEPTCTDTLSVAATALDADGDPLTYSYQWQLVGGEADWGYQSADGRLVGAALRKGQFWKCRCQAWDGTAWSEWVESEARAIYNSLPVLTPLTITPPQPHSGDTLSAHTTATDADGDPLTYLYQWGWMENGQWSDWGASSADGILTVPLRRLDQYRARCHVFDGQAWSEWVQADPVLVVNAPPALTRVRIAPAAPTGATTSLNAVVTAEDPDGDELTYEYRWSRFVDGAWQLWHNGLSVRIVPDLVLRKGDRWKVEARASDGVLWTEWLQSPIVIVGNRPPVVERVTVWPTPVTRNSIIYALATDYDPDGEQLTHEYEWCYRENTTAEWSAWAHHSVSQEIYLSEASRGQQWRVRCRAFDGDDYSEWTLSDPIDIANAPPDPPAEVTVTPANPATAADLVAVAGSGSDLDGDAVTAVYQWCKSADSGATWTEWTEGTETLSADLTTRGEQWKVRVAANDGTVTGPWRESEPVTIINTVPTLPTAVAISPAAPTGGSDLTATASGSTDADGDELTYVYEWSSSSDGATWSEWGIFRGAHLSADNTTVGERWRVRSRARDGIGVSGWKVSLVVRITAPAAPGALSGSAALTTGGSVAVTVTTAAAATVEGTVTNIAGRAVATLPARELPAGGGELLWNARSSRGLRVPAGHYLVHLRAHFTDGSTAETIVPLSLTR